MNTAPGVCVLGWVKCREQNFTAGYTLYNYVCDKKKKIFQTDIFFYKTDYGKMLKYLGNYRSTDISVDLYFYVISNRQVSEKNAYLQI